MLRCADTPVLQRLVASQNRRDYFFIDLFATRELVILATHVSLKACLIVERSMPALTIPSSYMDSKPRWR